MTPGHPARELPARAAPCAGRVRRRPPTRTASRRTCSRAPLGTPVEVCECRNAAAEVDWLAVRLLALQTVRCSPGPRRSAFRPCRRASFSTPAPCPSPTPRVLENLCRRVHRALPHARRRPHHLHPSCASAVCAARPPPIQCPLARPTSRPSSRAPLLARPADGAETPRRRDVAPRPPRRSPTWRPRPTCHLQITAAAPRRDGRARASLYRTASTSGRRRRTRRAARPAATTTTGRVWLEHAALAPRGSTPRSCARAEARAAPSTRSAPFSAAADEASLADREPPYGARLLEEEVRGVPRRVRARARAERLAGRRTAALRAARRGIAATRLRDAARRRSAGPVGFRDLVRLRAFVEHAAAHRPFRGRRRGQQQRAVALDFRARDRREVERGVRRARQRGVARPLGRISAASRPHSRRHLAQVLPLVGLDEDRRINRLVQRPRGTCRLRRSTRARKRLHVSYVVHNSSRRDRLAPRRASSAICPPTPPGTGTTSATRTHAARRHLREPRGPRAARTASSALLRHAAEAGQRGGGGRAAGVRCGRSAFLCSRTAAGAESKSKADEGRRRRRRHVGRGGGHARQGQGRPCSGAKAKATPAKAASEVGGGRRVYPRPKPAAFLSR